MIIGYTALNPKQRKALEERSHEFFELLLEQEVSLKSMKFRTGDQDNLLTRTTVMLSSIRNIAE